MQNQTSGAEWLTVKQFAVASGCSTQAVYKRLATTLKPHCKQENGLTYIHSSALNLQPLDNPAEVVNPLQESALAELRAEISRQAAELTEARRQLDHVRTELTGTRNDRERLTAELAAATRRADDAEARERATAAAAAERERAADQRATDAAAAAAERERTAAAQLSEALRALTTAQQHAADLTEALAAAQSLHAGTIRGQLDTAAAADQGRSSMPAGDDQTSAAARPPADQGDQSSPQRPADDADGAADQQPKQRRGLFARLFRRG